MRQRVRAGVALTGALALAVRGSQEEINSEMFVAIPED